MLELETLNINNFLKVTTRLAYEVSIADGIVQEKELIAIFENMKKRFNQTAFFDINAIDDMSMILEMKMKMGYLIDTLFKELTFEKALELLQYASSLSEKDRHYILEVIVEVAKAEHGISKKENEIILKIKETLKLN